MPQTAREQKRRAPEVPGLSKTKVVQNPEDFGLKMLPKSSVEHLYADLKLTDTERRQIRANFVC